MLNPQLTSVECPICRVGPAFLVTAEGGRQFVHCRGCAQTTPTTPEAEAGSRLPVPAGYCRLTLAAESRVTVAIAPGVFRNYARRDVARLLEDIGFAWHCLPLASRKELLLRHLAIVVEDDPATSPAGEIANGWTEVGGNRLTLSASLIGRDGGACAVAAHEIAHLVGHETEAGAWQQALEWLRGTGSPAQYAEERLRKLGVHDVN